MKTERGGLLGRIVGKPVFWIVALLFLFAWPVLRTLRRDLPPPPPVLAKVPPFDGLTDQHGRPFSSDDVAGRAWAFQFFWADCPELCQEYVDRMFKVQHRSRNLSTAFHRVSFSVKHDPPSRLAEYAREKRASLRMWSFLDDAPEGVKEAVLQAAPQVAPGDLEQGRYLILVDSHMQIRGVYDLTRDDAVDDLLYQAGLLVNLFDRPGS